MLSVIVDRPLALGLALRASIMLVLTFAASLVTFGAGRANILPGFVHLVPFVVAQAACKRGCERFRFV
jgi:Ca2+:H+ antiporter